ncbi:MAG: isopenicillin N synthase-like dioxygenase [Lysobacterales bacterium]|jgi:isopenicillin N synthase-like dioxygenase
MIKVLANKIIMAPTSDLNQSDPAYNLARDSIPNLDIAPLFTGDQSARNTLIEEIRAACLNTGFFYVYNSCVSDKLIQRALSSMAEFFNFEDHHPTKQKVHNRNFGGMKGWGPIFGEPAYQKDTIAHLESFDIGQQLQESQYRLLGITPNCWPELSGFQTAILEYYDATTLLGRALAGVFSELLGEDRDFINKHSGENAPRTLRLLHYPENDVPADRRNVGISAHSDFECFTIMNQTAEGLELTNVDGKWFKAPSDLGSFTIIMGDMMERFSNGHFKATGHRVVNTPWTRYSMVLFFAIDGDFSVAPLPRFVSSKKPDRYGAITQDQHIEQEIKRATENHSTTIDST